MCLQIMLSTTSIGNSVADLSVLVGVTSEHAAKVLNLCTPSMQHHAHELDLQGQHSCQHS